MSTDAAKPRDAVLQVRGVSVQHPRRHSSARSLTIADVSFDVYQSEIFGIVGESGSGKTTLLRAILQIPRPTAGTVTLGNSDLTTLRGQKLIVARQGIQVVFQDARMSLDPTWPVARIVAEPLSIVKGLTKRRRLARVASALTSVGLPEEIYGHRFSSQLSGGQCQRVALARALVVDPTILVLDEAVSALDPLVQVHVMGIISDLRTKRALSVIFVSHDLRLVQRFCDRVAVLHQGRICEIASAECMFSAPAHPYTRMLLSTMSPWRGDACARSAR